MYTLNQHNGEEKHSIEKVLRRKIFKTKTVHLFTFITSYKMKVLLGGMLLFMCLYNYYNITNVYKLEEYLSEDYYNNTIHIKNI